MSRDTTTKKATMFYVFIILSFYSYYSYADYVLLNENNVIIRYETKMSSKELIPKGLTEHEVIDGFYLPGIIFGVTKATLNKEGKVTGYYLDNMKYEMYTKKPCWSAF